MLPSAMIPRKQPAMNGEGREHYVVTHAALGKISGLFRLDGLHQQRLTGTCQMELEIRKKGMDIPLEIKISQESEPFTGSVEPPTDVELEKYRSHPILERDRFFDRNQMIKEHLSKKAKGLKAVKPPTRKKDALKRRRGKSQSIGSSSGRSPTSRP